MRRATPILALLFAFCFVAGARAHAIVVHSSPAGGESVAQADLPVEIRFNSRIDAKRSRLLLFRPDGSSLPLTILPIEAADTLRAEVHDLARGAYRLHWQTLSVDGHLTQGDILFRVDR